MYIIRVRTSWGALRVRRVRNAVREYMTHDQTSISPLRQLRWWRSLDHDEVEVYLARVDGRDAGYGIVRKVEGKWWVSGGLVEWARGKGHGRKLFTFLTARAVILGKESWLDVFDWNVAARRLYESIGYRYVDARVRWSPTTLYLKMVWR